MAGIPNPSSIPLNVRAGDTLKWKVSNSDFKASDGWTYKFKMSTASNKFGEYSSSADGADHQVTIEEGVTANWVAGTYRYVAWFEDTGGDRWTVDEGRLVIKADLAAASSAVDLRTHAMTALDAVEAVLESRASLDQQKYEIAGRSLDRTPVPDLLAFRDYYRKEVEEQERADRRDDGKSHQGVIRSRFADSQ